MRRDHYIAQFHLKEFLQPKCPDGRLHVYHKEQGLVDRLPIADLAQKPDFYPEAVDQRMKEIEGRACRALVDLTRGGFPRDGQRLSQLLDYVALTVCRSPYRLAGWRQFLEKTSQEYPEHQERWEEELRHETVCESIFTKFFPAVRPTLDWIKWNVIRAPQSRPFFIADNPVIFCPVGRSYKPNRWSYIAMPLGRHVALLGCRNLALMSKVFERGGYLNMVSLLHAEEHVFSGEPIDGFEEYQKAQDEWNTGPGIGVAFAKARLGGRKPQPVLRRR